MIINVNGKIDVNYASSGIFRETNIIFNFPKKIIVNDAK